MSKYARTRITTEVSDASDYSRAREYATEITHTPDEFRLGELIEVATAGQTYYLAHLNSVTELRIKNEDTSNYVTVAYTSVGNAGTNTVKIAAGKELVIPGGDVTCSGNLTLTANTAAVSVTISYLGT